MQILSGIVEAGFFTVFNGLRLHVVKETYLALTPAIHRRLSIIQVYATILWVVCMFSLLQHLWAALPVLWLDMAIQFLILVLGLSNMMGIALPFSALRGWVFVWYRRKAEKLSKSR